MRRNCNKTKAKKFVGSTFHVSLRKNDLTWITKSHTIATHSNNSFDLFDVTMEMIDKMWDKHTPIRSVRVCISNLCDENSSNQLSLFTQKDVKKQELDKAIDKIRDKYGYSSIKPLVTQNEELLNSEIKIDDEKP